jgi:hypothetical protein
VSQRVAAGERCVVIGWPIGRDGRKHHVGTALVTRRLAYVRRRGPRGSMSSGVATTS